MPGLKIAISGKGGVGKSTIAAVWARLLASKGISVLAIDADPDANLASALGLPSQLRSTIVPLSRNEKLIEERTGAKPGLSGQMFSLNPKVSDIAERFAVPYKGVNLLVLGAVKKGGGGCACPESAFLKSLVRFAVLQNDEAVILDMEAGVEHLGRATTSGVDAMVIVTEPGSRSIETAQNIIRLASDIGLDKKLYFILNKSRNEQHEIDQILGKIPDAVILGSIPYDERFIECDEKDSSMIDEPGTGDLVPYFQNAMDRLLKAVDK